MAKQIPLRTKDGSVRYALVDDEDFERLAVHSWYCREPRQGRGRMYATRSYYINQSPWVRGHLLVLMHREILGDDCPEIVDHIDRDGLNNTRANLRAATPRQNIQNRITNKGPKQVKSSRFKGVLWSKTERRWRAYIRLNSRFTHLGYFTDEFDAARAYDAAALEHFKQFARPNFPQLSIAS